MKATAKTARRLEYASVSSRARAVAAFLSDAVATSSGYEIARFRTRSALGLCEGFCFLESVRGVA